LKKLFFAILVFCLSAIFADGVWAAGHRHYDLQRSEALIKCGEALVASGGKPLSPETMDEIMPGLALIGQSSSLIALLNERTEQYSLYERAAELLAKGNYNALSAMIDDAEENGKATAYLLQLRGLPQAFQALALYCARRPYDTAEDLERALSVLEPFQESLSSSSRFMEFWRGEQDALVRLRASEGAARVSKQLHKLDWALATAGREHECEEIMRELISMKPQPALMRLTSGTQACRASVLLKECLDVSEDTELSIPDGVSTEEFELALALTWEQLSSAQRRNAQRWLRNAHVQTLTAQAMQAGIRGSLEQFIAALKSWRQRASARELRVDAPAFLPAMLQLASGGARPTAAQRAHWGAGAPGWPEILEALYDLSN
jgi:hypothetical protein